MNNEVATFLSDSNCALAEAIKTYSYLKLVELGEKAGIIDETEKLIILKKIKWEALREIYPLKKV